MLRDPKGAQYGLRDKFGEGSKLPPHILVAIERVFPRWGDAALRFLFVYARLREASAVKVFMWLFQVVKLVVVMPQYLKEETNLISSDPKEFNKLDVVLLRVKRTTFYLYTFNNSSHLKY